MKKSILFPFAAIVLSVMFAAGCNNTAPAKQETVAKTEEIATVITNPNFSIAPTEYATLSEQSLMHLAKFEFDTWEATLADNVIYTFPDGDIDTRTKLEGKAAVVGWWKGWKEKSGIESMTMSEFNHFPLNVTAQPKGGALMGNYDFVYFSNKMVFAGKPVALRMNFAIHFNTDKKIDRYITYYDRSVIIKATGKNLLEEMKATK